MGLQYSLLLCIPERHTIILCTDRYTDRRISQDYFTTLENSK